MSIPVHCDIVSAEEAIFSGMVEMVVATGTLGELGIAYGHAPLLTGLLPGPVRLIKSGEEDEVIYLSGGFLEVQPGVISILADTAVRANDLDEAAALEAQRKAEQALKDSSADINYAKAKAELAQAAAQLQALKKMKKLR